MSRELCVVAANRGFGDGDTKNAKKIQGFRKDCMCVQYVLYGIRVLGFLGLGVEIPLLSRD